MEDKEEVDPSENDGESAVHAVSTEVEAELVGQDGLQGRDNGFETAEKSGEDGVGGKSRDVHSAHDDGHSAIGEAVQQ